jgi:hypothetical protein
MRKAISVVLAGWYLLIPQYGKVLAPLGEWNQAGAFDSAKECEQMLKDVTQRAKERGKREDPDLLAVLPYARCIASDDPRSRQ